MLLTFSWIFPIKHSHDAMQWKLLMDIHIPRNTYASNLHKCIQSCMPLWYSSIRDVMQHSMDATQHTSVRLRDTRNCKFQKNIRITSMALWHFLFGIYFGILAYKLLSSSFFFCNLLAFVFTGFTRIWVFRALVAIRSDLYILHKLRPVVSPA